MTMLRQLVQTNRVNIQQLRQKVRSLMESFGEQAKKCTIASQFTILIYLGSLAVVSTSVRCIFLERHGPSIFSCYKLINWLLLLSLSDPQGYFWPPYFSSSLRPSYSRKVCFNIPFIRGLVNYRNWLVINLFVGFKSIISFFIYIVFITVFCT